MTRSGHEGLLVYNGKFSCLNIKRVFARISVNISAFQDYVTFICYLLYRGRAGFDSLAENIFCLLPWRTFSGL
jgi:hypothetical protein